MVAIGTTLKRLLLKLVWMLIVRSYKYTSTLPVVVTETVLLLLQIQPCGCYRYNVKTIFTKTCLDFNSKVV